MIPPFFYYWSGRPTDPTHPQVMYILTLGTLPEYRRLGLGKLLLQK